MCVLALREARLAHVEEFFPAVLGARARVDLQQHPFSAQLRKPEGYAVHAAQLGVAKRTRLDQLAVVDSRLRRPDEKGETGRDRRCSADRKQGQGNAPAPTALRLSRALGRLA